MIRRQGLGGASGLLLYGMIILLTDVHMFGSVGDGATPVYSAYQHGVFPLVISYDPVKRMGREVDDRNTEPLPDARNEATKNADEITPAATTNIAGYHSGNTTIANTMTIPTAIIPTITESLPIIDDTPPTTSSTEGLLSTTTTSGDTYAPTAAPTKVPDIIPKIINDLIDFSKLNAVKEENDENVANTPPTPSETSTTQVLPGVSSTVESQVHCRPFCDGNVCFIRRTILVPVYRLMPQDEWYYDPEPTNIVCPF